MTTTPVYPSTIPTTKVEKVESELLTGYASVQLVNAWLKSEGVSKELPPQMIYNYMKGSNPQIVSVTRTINGKDKKFIEKNELLRWFAQYFEKNYKK